MGSVDLPHYVVRKGSRGYWLVTPKMKAAGFENVRCGPDGPEAWKIAREWEGRWQAYRKGVEPAAKRRYPIESVGDAFERFRRTDTWKAKEPRTREDWERSWPHIDSFCGDQHPREVTFELLDIWYHGLLRRHGVDTAYRAMKIWRALHTVMAGMQLVVKGQDPSMAIRRKTPAPRTASWIEGEAVRLVKGAWRAGYQGLACIFAVAWDTSCSPVDVRTLTQAQMFAIGESWGFKIVRKKTGEEGIGTFSARTRRLVQAYVTALGVTILPDAPLFRTRGYAPGPKGGRPRAGVPYTKNSLVNDVAAVRRLVFGDGETRRLMDMRRSGSLEILAGGGSVEAMSAKLANSMSQNRALQKTYLPIQIEAVQQADEARIRGRRKRAAEQTADKKLKLGRSES